ncbi:hypothetical protein ACQJBY_038949 [Aegilops geniculata]
MDIKDKDLASEDSLRALYERWCEHYRVARDLDDKTRRFNVFKENARMIHKFYQGDALYKLSINLFGDMTDEEVHRAYGRCSNIKSDGRKHRRQGQFTDDAINARKGLPSSVDWRKRPSAVTNVKLQGVHCGSCWAFAATAAVEGINSIRTRNLTSLSTQQLVDCDKGNGGCKGGFAKLAFKYIMQSGGIENDAKYPYVGHQDGHCSVPKPNWNTVVTIDGYKQVVPNEVVALEQAVAAQPVVVGVDSNSTAFQRYGRGVFVGPCGTNLDHEMTVVGYGTTDKHETNNLCQFQVQGNQLDQLHAVAARFEAKVFSDSDNVQNYLRTISIKMMTLQSKWQPAASDQQAHTGGQVRPLNAVPAAAATMPPPMQFRPPQAQNMQITHKPSQQPPMAPLAQPRPCHPTAAAQIQTQSLSRHNNSSGMCTQQIQQPVARAAFIHQAHMPLKAVTQFQSAVPRTASTNRLPPTDQGQNMGINPIAPTVQLHPCHPTAVNQIQTQPMARHNSSGMRAQQPQTKLTSIDQQEMRVNQQPSYYQAHAGQQSNVAALQIGHSGGQTNQQFGHHPVEVDWREDMFQRITSLKVAHFSELVEFQRAIQARIPQRITNQQLESLPKEQADKYRKLVDTMAKIGSALSFLQLQKSNIPEAMKDQFDKHETFLYRILHFHRAMKDRLQNPPRAVNTIGATDSQQKHQEQPAAETRFSQSSENVPATSPLVQQQENSHHLGGEEAVDDEVRHEAEAPVATNLTGGSTAPFTGGSGTCSQEKQQEQPAYEAIPQLTQNVNPVETPPAQQQTNRSLSPAALRSLAQDMGVNLKRAFRHTMSGSCAWFDESSGESCNKRRKMHALRDEIRAAYSMVVETEIRITDDDTGGAEGAVVIELCYIPVSLTPDLRAAIDPSEMSTKLLVPADYPRSSPVLLGDDGGHRKGIAAGVLDVEFRRVLGQLPEPRSIKGIAQAWDACVRRAVVQFAHGLGGGTFSTRHGRWESGA